MFNLWNRSYVHTFAERYVFESTTILADPEYAHVVFMDNNFGNGGKLLHQSSNIQTILDDRYSGVVGNLFAAMLTNADDKWSIAVKHEDYHYLLACYMKELQFALGFSDEDLHLLTFSYLYDNFYYTLDAKFVEGFVSGEFQEMVKRHWSSYVPTGVLKVVDPESLPTEIAYFLVKRGIIKEEQISGKFAAVAKLVIAKLGDVHHNDFSEWLVLDTKHFLNMFRSDDTPAVETDNFSLQEMLAYIKGDRYLNTMFFRPYILEEDATNWETNPSFKAHASRLITMWERLADYVVQRGADATWIKARAADYAETAAEYSEIKNACQAVRYILKLDNAPETVDEPLVDMLGYETIVDSLNTKYNKSILLMAMHGSSETFAGFARTAFED